LSCLYTRTLLFHAKSVREFKCKCCYLIQLYAHFRMLVFISQKKREKKRYDDIDL